MLFLTTGCMPYCILSDQWGSLFNEFMPNVVVNKVVISYNSFFSNMDWQSFFNFVRFFFWFYKIETSLALSSSEDFFDYSYTLFTHKLSIIHS